MDFAFLDRKLFDSTRNAVRNFKQALEGARPTELELKRLTESIRAYPHSPRIDSDFIISAVDGSGEFPVLQQDDVLLHFVVAAAATYRTLTQRQHKLASLDAASVVAKHFVMLNDQSDALVEGYRYYLQELTGLDLKDLVEGSDYCEVFSSYSSERIKPSDVKWVRFPFARASQIGTHAYLIRSMAELGMAIRMLEHKPRYLLLDTSLVYFLLGETLYLPELLKRYLVNRANAQGTCVVALCKSHNIPNGDVIGRLAQDDHGLADHWYLRLPSPALGESAPNFVEGREIPPKLSVSYLFKFEATSFPLRLDLDSAWWKEHIGNDKACEQQFFCDLDFTCHEVRSYGYPYPMHAAHRLSSLTKQERRALKDILLQQAQRDGLLRGSLAGDPEALHMAGM